MSLRTRLLGAVVVVAATSVAQPPEAAGHGRGGFHAGGFHPGAFPGNHFHTGAFAGNHFHPGAGHFGGFHGGSLGGFGFASGGFGFGGLGVGGWGHGSVAHGHHGWGRNNGGGNGGGGFGGGGGGGGGDGGGGYAVPYTSGPVYPDADELAALGSGAVGPYNFLNGLSPRTAPAGDASAAAARLTVTVPPDAALWFNSVLKEETGRVRVFQSPPLTPGEDYLYQVHARWTESGQTVHRIRMVRVQANEHVKVDLTQALPGDMTIP
jgi:uncharacterized protein (TIGR03000 family)